jgi:hypothetical protein
MYTIGTFCNESIFVASALISQGNTQTMHIFVNYTKEYRNDIPKKLMYAMAGFEPGSSAPKAGSTSSVPRRQGYIHMSRAGGMNAT